MKGLIVFDWDGTIVNEPEFSKKWFSGTLDEVIKKERGEEGFRVLQECRKNFNGKGELALFALDIPYREWAKEMIDASLDLIKPQPRLVRQIRELQVKKVIFTGTPVKLVIRMVEKIGFTRQDFNLIIGWEEPEWFPIKWNCSPLVFRYILNKFQINPQDAWSVGDDWKTDLKPAQVIGMRTAKIGKLGGKPTLCVPSLQEFLKHIKGGDKDGGDD